MKSLIGKTITEIAVSLGKEFIRLAIQDEPEPVYFYTFADCCSESWIEHMSLPTLPAVVESIKESTPVNGCATRQEYDQIYLVEVMCKAKYTTRWTIEFRNSSNGYYGGALYKCNEFGIKRATEQTFAVITEDF